MRRFKKMASQRSLSASQRRWSSALREDFSCAEQLPGSAAQQLSSSASTGGNFDDADAGEHGDAEGAALPLRGPGSPVPHSPRGRADPPPANGSPTLINPTAVPPPWAPAFSTRRTTRRRRYSPHFLSYSLHKYIFRNKFAPGSHSYLAVLKSQSQKACR